MSSKSLMRFASRYSCWSSLRCRTILVLWPNALPLVRKRAPFDCRPVSLGTSTLENESQVCLCSVCWAGALCGFGRKGHGPGEADRGPRWALAAPCSTSVLRSAPCPGARRGRHLLISTRLHPAPYSYWRILNTACSLYIGFFARPSLKAS